MKVLHIITSLNQGGAENALYSLITNDNNLTKSFVISLIDSSIYADKLTAHGIEVHSLGFPRGQLTLKGIIKLSKLIRKINPDIVQTWMYHADLIGGIIARFLGYKNIVWGIVHFNLNPKLMSFSTYYIIKLCALLSGVIPQKIICCSFRAAQVHYKFGYSEGKITTINLGYDINKFVIDNELKKSAKNQFGIRDTEIILGCVGRWNPDKDHTNLLRALAILKDDYPQVYCSMVGTNIDNQNDELNKLIHDVLGENNKLILNGWVENVIYVMNSFDLLVLPSVGEAFPNVVAEAMALGIPCVVTDVGDAAEIVGETGWVVPVSNPNALAQAIIMAIDEMQNTDKWDNRSVECRQRIINNYSLEKMTNCYINIWNSILIHN